MLYQAYQLQSDLLSPFRLMAQSSAAALWMHKTDNSLMRKLSASMDVFSRMRLTHARPPYAIASVTVGERDNPGVVETLLSKPIWTLRRVKKAPLSDHFATLLRETAKTLLQDHDVYITDWHNARDVSLRHGPFALDDYIDHMIRFTQAIGPGAHLVAVCQPCVAALAATAIMAEDDDPAQPRSLTLMAGPVDCRVNPTGVNLLATSKPISGLKPDQPCPFPTRASCAVRGFAGECLHGHERTGTNSRSGTCTAIWWTAMWRRPTPSALYDEYPVSIRPSSIWRRWRRCSRPTTCRWESSSTGAAPSTLPPSAAPP